MVRLYIICYRKNAVRHIEATFREYIEALRYISDKELINRYRVQIVNGNNTELLFDSASVKKHEVFYNYIHYVFAHDMYRLNDIALIENNPHYIKHIRNMCVLNKDRCKHYKSSGYLLNDQYC